MWEKDVDDERTQTYWNGHSSGIWPYGALEKLSGHWKDCDDGDEAEICRDGEICCEDETCCDPETESRRTSENHGEHGGLSPSLSPCENVPTASVVGPYHRIVCLRHEEDRSIHDDVRGSWVSHGWSATY